MLNNGDIVLLALSGGCDSVSLLYVLNSLKDFYKIDLNVFHMNHNLRGEDSQRDEEFVKKLCKTLKIPIFIHSNDVKYYSISNKITIEEAGRKLRYEYLQKTIKDIKGNKIVTAHNKNDSVETIIFNIIRGTGISGLKGIPKVKDNIIRPLIDCTRIEIENFCILKNIKYRTDKTNLDLIYTRNKIRHKVLKNMSEINQNVVETIFESSKNFEIEDNFLEFLAKEEYKKCLENLKNKNIALNLEKFNSINIALKRRVVRIVLSNFYKNLENVSQVNVDDIIKLASNETGKKINLKSDVIVTKLYKHIVFENKTFIENKLEFCYNIKSNDFLYIKELDLYVTLFSKCIFENDDYLELDNIITIAFDESILKQDLQIRTRKTGDILQNNGTQKLKSFFTNKKIPLNERNMPILAHENNILWIMNYYISKLHESKINNKSAFLQIWKKVNLSDSYNGR
ncbi:MAG: tRNA lysidine(34) synthetase TilS [Defluviitaleaceae bacterium]|nr:tRNA lysidine(34) synthetase TilS [Defluviitaleaceae bacterium]